MKKYFSMKKMISVLCALVLIVTAVFEPSWFGKMSEGMDEVAAATEEPPTDFVELGWRDFTGLSYEKYTSAGVGTYDGAETLDRTLLNDDVTMGLDSYIRYGGNSWNSFQIKIVADSNNSYAAFDASPMGTVVDGNDYVGKLFSNAEFDLVSLVDTRFNLKISTEVLDNGNYKFGIWINNIMAGGYITIQPNANCTGTGAAIDPLGNSVTLDKVVQEAPTDFVELGWKDFTGLSYETYAGAKESAYGGAETLDRTLLNDDITIGQTSYIRYGGNGWFGFEIQIVADTNNSYVYMKADDMGTVVGGTGHVKTYDITNAVFELESLVDTRFNLKISTEILDGGNYKFGVWINDIMAGGYITVQPKENCAGTSAIINPNNQTVTLDKVVQEAPTDFVELGWRDFTGLSYETYTGAKESAYGGAETLDRTLLNDDITIGQTSYIRYGGNGWFGFEIQIVADTNNSYVYMKADDMGTVVGGMGHVKTYDITNAVFELESLVDTRFNLKISTEVLDGGNYKFGVWINDIMAGGYITVQPKENCAGTSAMISPAGNGVTLHKATREIPADFTKLTWADFESLSYKKYEVNGYDSLSGTYNGSLHKTLLEDEINIANNTSIRYAGVGGTTGFKLTFVKDTSFNYIYPESNAYGTVVAGKSYVDNGLLTHIALGMEPFVGETINLKISTEIYGDYYKFGIWINDVIMGDYITIKTDASANMRGTTVSFTEDDPNTTTVELIRAGSTPPTDFAKLIWTDFEDLKYQTYQDAHPALAGSGIYNGTGGLHQTLLDDNVLLGNGTEIRYGANGWYGLGIYVSGDDEGNSVIKLYDHWNNSDTPFAEFNNPTDFNLSSFVNEEFNLKISTEINGNDYTFGIWINGKQLGYYTLDTNGNGGITVGLVGGGSGNAITLKKQPINPPTDFTTLGWNDFTGLICKEYVKPNPGAGAVGTYAESLHQTLLDGNIIFNGKGDLRYASSDGWGGITIECAEAGDELSINKGTFEGDYSEKYKPEEFGLTSFKGKEFNLKISTEIAGDKYTFGIWINDQMLGKYFTLTKGGQIGEKLGLYDWGSGTNIQLVGEKVPTDYTILTPLTSFGIKSGTYTAPDGGQADPSNGAPSNPANGVLDGVLDETATVFDKVIIQFHTIKYEENVDLGFGGYNIWTGYRLGSNGENLRLYSGYEQMILKDSIILTDEIAGVDVVGGEYNLKISMAYIDSTTVQMGIWFDDILYNNEYFMIDTSKATGDIANDIGGDDLGLALGVLSQNGGGTIIIGEEVVTLPDFYWNKSDGAYTLPDTAKIGSIDEGESISELTELGENTFLYHADGRIYTRTVHIWEIGKVTEDDRINSCDLIRVKSLNGSTKTNEWSSQTEAADFDKDEDVDSDDAHNMRRLLLGEEFNYEKTLSDKLFGGVVDANEKTSDIMPIVGFHGPSSSWTVEAVDGETYNSKDMLADGTIDDIYNTIDAAGINLIVGSHDVYSDQQADIMNIEKQLEATGSRGIAMFLEDARIDKTKDMSHEELQRYLDSYADNKSFAGLFISDEIRNATERYPYNPDKPDDYMGTSIDDVAALGKKVYGYENVTGYSTLFPYYSTLATNGTTTYQNYLTEYVEKLAPSYLSFDYYPFSRLDDSTVTESQVYDDYMKNLVLVREKALKNDIPFWAFVQAGSEWQDLDEGKAVYGSKTTNNTPSEGQFKWQANISLAMGAKGIAYFPLVQPHYFALSKNKILGSYYGNNEMNYQRNGLIGADGSKTQWYNYAVAMNQQIAAIDNVLMNSTSKGVVVYDGAATYLNGNLNSLCDSNNPVVISSYNQFTGVSSTGTAGAVVGCFDYNGKTALYVVNYDVNTARDITLNFSESVTADVTTSGTATEKSGSSMTLSLGAGEGALVVLE